MRDGFNKMMKKMMLTTMSKESKAMTRKRTEI